MQDVSERFRHFASLIAYRYHCVIVVIIVTIVAVIRIFEGTRYSL